MPAQLMNAKALLKRQFAWNAKSYFLRKIKKKDFEKSAEIFTQHLQFELFPFIWK